MMRSKTWTVGGAALLLFVASAAWGGFDSPAGVGFDFPENKSGDLYSGFVTVVFDGVDVDLTASSFQAVAQLQRRKVLHVFQTLYTCGGGDPCAICTSGRIDVTQAVTIAQCLTEQIQPEVLADFGLGELDVRLRSVSQFVSEADPGDASVRAVAGTIEVTVK